MRQFVLKLSPREAGTVATEAGFVELIGGADAPGEEAAPQRGIGYEAASELAHEGQDLALGGVTANPTGEWTVQQARNLALSLDERFEDIKLLIRDRGSNFTASFDAVFQVVGTRILRCAVQAPLTNAICERLVGTLRRELLDRVLILGEAHLRTVLAEYQAHYNTARPSPGSRNVFPTANAMLPLSPQPAPTSNGSAETRP